MVDVWGFMYFGTFSIRLDFGAKYVAATTINGYILEI